MWEPWINNTCGSILINYNTKIVLISLLFVDECSLVESIHTPKIVDLTLAIGSYKHSFSFDVCPSDPMEPNFIKKNL